MTRPSPVPAPSPVASTPRTDPVPAAAAPSAAGLPPPHGGELPTPHGGELKILLGTPGSGDFKPDGSGADSAGRDGELGARVAALKSLTLSPRQSCDLELLMSGAFSPLTGFMTQDEYESVLEHMRLPQGALWPLPITLDIPEALAESLPPGTALALRDGEGVALAILHVESRWRPDKRREAALVYGTEDPTHPGVRHLYEKTQAVCVGGRLEGIEALQHFDFTAYRYTPQGLRERFAAQGWTRVLAFHTAKPMHRVHVEITAAAAREHGAKLLIHPAAGLTKPGDLQYFARVRCYQAVLGRYPPDTAMLSLLPIALRMAGPREALLNMIVRQNYGCSLMLVGPEHAAPPDVRAGGPRFYPPYAAQELVAAHQKELAIRMVSVRELCYDEAAGRFFPSEELARLGRPGQSFADRELGERLARDVPVPDWASFPEVLEVLRKVRPPRRRAGMTVFFTGLSGAGKSTLARLLYARLIESDDRPVTLLDGDVVRQHLSRELGFSKRDRDINVRRIGFVAAEITKNGGIAICAPIAPYAETRRAVREMVEEYGSFIEAHVATPLAVCESRDRKGLYAKARQGLIPEFTGVSDPYEAPVDPEVAVDTSARRVEQNLEQVLNALRTSGFIVF